MTTTNATQTAVTDSLAGYAGQLADTGEAETKSFLVEGATEVPFGALVVHGTAGNQGKAPAAAADVTYAKVLGILKHSHAYAKDTELGDTGLKQYATGSAVTEGRIRVACSEAVDPSAAVRVRADTNAGSDALLGPGTFCKTASAGHTVALTKGARWISTTTGADFPILEIDVNSLTLTAD